MSYSDNWDKSHTELKDQILLSESYIILDNWDKLVSKKLLNRWFSPEELKNNSIIKKKDSRTYFIFTEKFKWFWEVKTLFDITEFVKTQVFVMKASLVAILISILAYFLLWKYFTKLALRDLRKVIKFTKNLNTNQHQSLYINAPKDDEIRIVAESLNKYNQRIVTQTENLKWFICNIAHEFKTPLMVINSDIDLYKATVDKKGYSKELEAETLCKIKCKVRGLNETLETLFYVSRLEEWIIIFKKDKINISWYVKNLSEELLKVYSDKNLKVEYDIKDDILLHIDETSFKIIVKNLLQNAFKYNKKEGSIKIHMCEKYFYIEDTWVWISKINLEKIWNNFFRAQENWDWIGLGLYLVRKLVNLYGYEIEVESEEGKWTKFKIIF